MAQKKLLSPTSPGYIASTQPLINKSQYLANALDALNKGNQDVKGGWGEVAARIGTSYLLNRGIKKNDEELAGVVAGQRKAKGDAALAALGGLLGDNPSSAVGGVAASPAAMPVTPASAPAGLAAALSPPAQASPAPPSPSGKQPLSVRNNNPGNLRWDGKSQWQGMKGVDPKGFVQFLTPEAGTRAAGINLGNQQKLHGLNTLADVITKYAPQSDNNDTAAYIQTVAQKTGFAPNQPLNLQDPAVQAKILPVMFGVESGGTPAKFPPQPQQAMAQPMPAQPAGNPSPVSPPAGPTALQAAPAGGSAYAHAPIDPQEIAYAKQLLQSQDPAEQEQGYAMVQKLKERAMTPVKYEVGSVNGVPTWNNPYQPGQSQTGAIPQGAMSQTVSAQDLGIQAPQGTAFSRTPTGQVSQVYAPPSGYESTPQGQQVIKGGSADPLSGQNLISGESSLRAEYGKGIQDYIESRNGYQKVIQAAGNDSGAGDIALTFGFMKTLDPGSTVREGEAATVQNTANIPDRIRNTYNQLLGDKAARMQPGQRQELIKAAKSQFDVYQRRADQMNERYSGLAQSYGYDPTRVVQQFPALEDVQSAAPSGPRGAQQGGDGNYYAPDPTKPGSFPQARQAADGNWYIKQSNGKYWKLD